MNQPQPPQETAPTQEYDFPRSEDFKLDFSGYSQVDSRWGFQPGTERSMCGIICTKAVLDYYGYQTGETMPDPLAILEAVRASHEWDSTAGIGHHAEVLQLAKHGLTAWRRNWLAPSSNPQWFADNEGYTPQQLQAVAAQQAAEREFTTDRDKQHYSIVQALKGLNPVIASVAKGYGGNGAGHQVVVIGYGHEVGSDYFWVMDPERAPGSNINKDDADHFFEYFNQRAIFMRQSSSSY